MRSHGVPLVVLSLVTMVSLLALVGHSLPSVQAEGAGPSVGYVPGEILVKFRPEAGETARLDARGDLQAVARHTFRSGAEHWILGGGVNVEDALSALRSNRDVLYAEPNLIGTFEKTPDDDQYANQWALPIIDAPGAWGITTGSSSVVIAVLDTGVETGYPDLLPNRWSNPNEIADNSIDDDGNGYVDDKYGWDFADDDNDPTTRDYSSAYTSHGTPVAGIIGATAAESGGFGMAGINWSVKLMNLRTGRTTAILGAVIEAVDYAVDNGAHILNMSIAFTCTPTCSQALREALERAAERDVLAVAGAGNSGVDIDADPNFGLAPASYDLDNIIVAASSDPNDMAVYYPPNHITNYGAVSVDLAAPGLNILSLADPCLGDPNCSLQDQDPNDQYDYFNGTSFATPHVTGVAGLVKSLNLGIPYELIRLHILDPNNLDSVYSPDPNFAFVTVTDGRLNAYKAVAGYDPNAPAQITDLSAGTTTKHSVQLNWTATADDGSDPNSGATTLNQLRYSTSTITSGNWLLAKRLGGLSAPGDPNSAESTTVDGLACNTTYYFALKSFDEWGNGPLSNVVSRSTSAPLCTVSFCAYEERRCTWSGQCGPGDCCVYTCHFDETCTGADTCPTNACNCS